MAVYLVTGGAGFIGSSIVRALLQQGEDVRVLDNFSTGRRQNLASLGNSLEVIEGDLRDRDVVRRAIVGVDYVLHQAALPSVARSIVDPISTHDVNATGSLLLLDAAKRAGVRRVVSASSSSIYGDGPTLPKHEDMIPRPKSPYAASKLALEHYSQTFFEVYGLETVCLRYFNVFGPRQDPSSEYSAVIPKFIYQMLKGHGPVVYGDGSQSRDFTYVANVVDANLRAATSLDAAGCVFNIACGSRYTLLDLVDLLNEILGTRLKPQHVQPRVGDVRHSLADIDAASRVLGYQPQIAFAEGLRNTVVWYRGVSA